MPVNEYQMDGDEAFIGLNSRENPLILQKGLVSRAENVRFDRGVARTRKGSKRLTQYNPLSPFPSIYGSCVITRTDGSEAIVLVVPDRIYVLNQETGAFLGTVLFPSGETVTESCDVYQAQGIGYVYICRGLNKTTLRWNGEFNPTSITIPTNQSHHNYPNTPHAVYYGNRHIVQTDRNSFRVSHYLSDTNWSALDMFSINDGANDALIAITPWTLNEFVVFMRNSVFYASVGIGAYLVGNAVDSDNSYVKSLATDIGCIARRSIVQAGGGIIFLSDNGVYILNPAGAGQGGANTAEGMRLLTMAEPLSAPIEDVILRINYNHAHKSVGIYWENRYYLAVPLDNSEVNNAILVYNFINKNWESVDTYQQDFDIQSFHVAKKGNRRRLFAVDQQLGVYLMEELEWDEYDAVIGVPTLGPPGPKCFLPFTLAPLEFRRYNIDSVLVTRAYGFNTTRDKRFSKVDIDVELQPGANIKLFADTTNPDTSTELMQYGSALEEDVLLRNPVRKTAQYIQIKVENINLRPTIKSIVVEASSTLRNTQSKS
jgi:hypothetical protein